MSTRTLLASASQLENLAVFPLTCPLCGAPLINHPPRHDVSEISCPRCNRVVDSKTVLGIVRDLQIQRDILAENLSNTLAEAALIEAQIEKLLLMRFITRRRLANSLRMAKLAVSEFEKKLASIDKAMRDCMALEYYLGDWYRETRVPAARQCKNHGRVKGIVPVFADGEANVLAASEPDIGTAGEFAVFRLLKRKSEDPDSALFESAVIPRAKLRWALWEESALSMQEREIDCLVATGSCLFLIEVKTINTHVLASNSIQRIAFSKQANVPKPICVGKEADKVTHRPFKKNARILAQSKDEAEAAARSSLPYPASRIFRVVIFVEPESFTNKDCGFCERLLIGCILNGRQTFLSALERESAAHSAFITRQELKELGGKVQCSISVVPEDAETNQAA